MRHKADDAIVKTKMRVYPKTSEPGCATARQLASAAKVRIRNEDRKIYEHAERDSRQMRGKFSL
jgi:hypothetical protein